MLVERLNGPTMFARIGVMRALNRGHVREFNPSPVKNSQVVDLESGNGALGQLGLPGIGSAEGDSLQI
jgi:hypothetical protein